MKASALLFLLSVILVQQVWASNVIVGTTENFDALIEKNEFVLAEFYAPWCGHCKKLEPEYEKAATSLKDSGSKVVLVKVDATIEAKLGESYNIRGYPTLIFFVNGKMIPYEGDRSSQGIVDWVTRKSGPPSVLLSSEAEQNTLTESLTTGVIVGIFTGEESPNFITYQKFAQTEDGFKFAHRFDASATETIFVVTKDKETKTFTGDITEESLKEFVAKEGHPLIVELDQKVWQRSTSTSTTMLSVFFDPKQSFEELATILKEVAKENKGKLIVSYMNGVSNEQLVSRWGGSGKSLPTAFVISYEAGSAGPKVTAWNEEEEKAMTVESLSNFVKKCIEGTYVAYKKSEEIPATNDEPVKIVVGKTFDSIVNDANKDVLLEVYAPWCGHCKNLEPIYLELAKKFSGIESVTIAKIDGTANALPENTQIKGFPTILFYPANDKTNPVSYEGNRDLEDLIKFVVDKATHKIQFSEGKDDL